MLDDDVSGEVEARARQGGSNLDPTIRPLMDKVINCPCGFVVKGNSNEELVARAQEHAKQVHQMG